MAGANSPSATYSCATRRRPKRVSFQRARAAAQLLRNTSILGIPQALLGVNVDRPGLRERFNAPEAIIGEENSASMLRINEAQTVPARSGIPIPMKSFIFCLSVKHPDVKDSVCLKTSRLHEK